MSLKVAKAMTHAWKDMWMLRFCITGSACKESKRH